MNIQDMQGGIKEIKSHDEHFYLVFAKSHDEHFYLVFAKSHDEHFYLVFAPLKMRLPE